MKMNRAVKTLDVGIFTGFADAVIARKAAEAEHGYHVNHGGFC